LKERDELGRGEGVKGRKREGRVRKCRRKERKK